ncbi:AbiTii domain-containing protein [Nocardia nova]
MMTLLETVIEEAQGTGSVPSLLRRMKTLAVRTGARDTLLPWVDRELRGYTPDDPFPKYRGPFDVSPVGNFVGMGGVQLNGHTVSRSGFSDSAATSLFTCRLYGSVAEVEACSQSKTLHFNWPGEAVGYYNSLIRNSKTGLASHFACLGVTYRIPRAIYIDILDQVRNLALDLALELEAVAPQAGEPSAGDNTNTEARHVIEQHWHIETMSVSDSNLTFGSSGAVAQKLTDGG